MSDDASYLTPEKYDELKREHQYLTSTRRREIAESLEYARSLGDLSENAEYAEARELQAATEERIRRIETVLANAKILTKKKSDVVTLGSKVTIRKQRDTEPHTYTIVGSEETNMLDRKLSHLSPLGEALMGKKKGDEFSFETPSGKQKYTIVSVE